MNTNEISPKPIVQFKQIRKVSRVIKFLFLFYLVTFGWVYSIAGIVRKTPMDGYWRVFGFEYATLSDVPFVNKLIALIALGLFLAAIVTVFQLLNLYGKGIIFSEKNVRLLGRIGWLVCGYGLITVCGPTLLAVWYNWINNAYFENKILIFGIIYLLGSPWVAGGLFLIVIARIMDEGRKIQEDQDLTV